MDLAGKFIVLDGPDGCGKGTQLQRLQAWVQERGGAWVYAKDPGGTEIGDRIRHILLGLDLARMHPRCETLLFMASRAQLAAEVIRPALARGATVLGDRFISATCAYQVAAGFPRQEVIELGKLALGQTWPDLTIVLDVPPGVGFARIGRTPQRVAGAKRRREDSPQLIADVELDAMEQRSLDFHRRVRENFLALPEFFPAPVVVVDANAAIEQVWTRVRGAIERAFV